MAPVQESSLSDTQAGSLDAQAATGIASPAPRNLHADLSTLLFFDGVTIGAQEGLPVTEARQTSVTQDPPDSVQDWHRAIILDTQMPAWFRPNPQVQRYPPSQLVDGSEDTMHVNLDRLAYWDISLNDCERALLESEPVLKLSGIGQMAVRFSERGRWMTHSRLDHTVDVMEAAGRIAQNLQLPRYEVQLARLAGLLHDSGHIAFAHAGEAIVRSLDDDPNYDHDVRVLELLRHGELHDLLCQFNRADSTRLPADARPEEGIAPLDIIAILDESKGMTKEALRQMLERTDLSDVEQAEVAYELRRLQLGHIQFIVKEVADRSYMRTDVAGTEFSLQVKEKFFAIYDAFEQSVRITPPAQEFKERRIFFEDLQPARQLMAVRDALFHEYSCSPAAEVATALLERGILEAIENSQRELQKDPTANVLTVSKLHDVDDDTILSKHLQGRYREWFYDTPSQIGGCIEHIVSPVVAYSRSALTDRGQEYVLGARDSGEIRDSQFMEDLRSLAAEQIPAIGPHLNDLLLVATCDYSKKMPVRYMSHDGEIEIGELQRQLPLERRYFLVTVPSDGTAGVSPKDVTQLQALALELLSRPEYLKENSAPLTDRIFGKLDAALYIDA